MKFKTCKISINQKSSQYIMLSNGYLYFTKKLLRKFELHFKRLREKSVQSYSYGFVNKVVVRELASNISSVTA